MSNRAQTSLAVVFVLIAAVCGRLGLWQLDRLHARRAANALTAAKRALPPVTLSTREDDTSLVQRRAAATGRFDYGREIIIRGQVLEGVPGVHVVTPLRLAGTDAAVLVNRGFVPSPDALTVPALDSLREPGVVHITGIALPIERNGRGRPLTHAGRTSWARLDLDALEDSLPYHVLPIYLRRTASASTPGSALSFPRALPNPPLDDGPHLSYALQWCGFMLVALAFAGIVLRKSPRRIRPN